MLIDAVDSTTGFVWSRSGNRRRAIAAL